MTDDDVLSLAIFICQELGFEWSGASKECDWNSMTPSQDEFIELARKIIDLQRNG